MALIQGLSTLTNIARITNSVYVLQKKMSAKS